MLQKNKIAEQYGFWPNILAVEDKDLFFKHHTTKNKKKGIPNARKVVFIEVPPARKIVRRNKSSNLRFLS